MVTLDYQNTAAVSHHHQLEADHQTRQNMSQSQNAVSGSGKQQPPKSAVSTRSVNIKLASQKSVDKVDLAKRAMRLDLSSKKSLDEVSIKSPKSPLSGVRLPHQTSLTSQVEAGEDRKTLRDALYQGIFHRHRRTIFAVGSFLRMLRSRNSQYNTIRSSSEGEDVDEEVR